MKYRGHLGNRGVDNDLCRRRARRDQKRRRIPALPAAILARPEPDRTGLRQAQGPLRKAAAKTVEDLYHAIADALDQFPPEECWNYIINTGYEPD